MSAKPVPDYFNALIGWRSWALTWINGYPLLKGIGDGARIWRPYEAKPAECVVEHEVTRDHGAGFGDTPMNHMSHDGQYVSAPVKGCTCGYWAFRSESDHHNKEASIVYGSVAMWGRVIEHELGYRSEFAYPRGLYCSDANATAKLAQVYGVPCVQFERTDSYDGNLWNLLSANYFNSPPLFGSLMNYGAQPRFGGISYTPPNPLTPWQQDFMDTKDVSLLADPMTGKDPLFGLNKPAIDSAFSSLNFGWDMANGVEDATVIIQKAIDKELSRVHGCSKTSSLASYWTSRRSRRPI